MTVEVIRTDGTRETRDIMAAGSIETIQALIGAECLDTVNLLDGRVMLVDDEGHRKASPVNAIATDMYLARCRPGTTHQIRGHVVVAVDMDFA